MANCHLHRQMKCHRVRTHTDAIASRGRHMEYLACAFRTQTLDFKTNSFVYRCDSARHTQTPARAEAQPDKHAFIKLDI